MDKELMMMMMVKMENNPYLQIDQEAFSSLFPSASEADRKSSSSSLGFMDLLGFQDFYSTTTSTTTPSLVFDDNNTFDQHQVVLPPPVLPLSSEHVHHDVKQDDGDENDNKEEDGEEEEEEEESSVVLSGQQQQPLSPNSSCISSPAHQLLHKPNKQCMKAKKTMGGNETKTTTKKKKEKEARFAFMTRTEIDHLDDGYRWRKYGQKAVKNSHFPRSYYRCTSASCNVKKRVERCMSDPSYVVTTYEGQHTHPVNSNSAPLIPSFNHLQAAPVITTTPPAMLKLDQGGLLQDMMFYHQQHH